MNSLRLEADENAAKVEELQGKLKTLEQENLAKDQSITSLEHNKGLLEDRVEKLEAEVKDLKAAAAEGQQQGTQAETLARRLQLLEEEAEEADKTLREANEKCVHALPASRPHGLLAAPRNPLLLFLGPPWRMLTGAPASTL